MTPPLHSGFTAGRSAGGRGCQPVTCATLLAAARRPARAAAYLLRHRGKKWEGVCRRPVVHARPRRGTRRSPTVISSRVAPRIGPPCVARPRACGVVGSAFRSPVGATDGGGSTWNFAAHFRPCHGVTAHRVTTDAAVGGWESTHTSVLRLYALRARGGPALFDRSVEDFSLSPVPLQFSPRRFDGARGLYRSSSLVTGWGRLTQMPVGLFKSALSAAADSTNAQLRCHPPTRGHAVHT